jgi:hypothetical protein
MEELGQPANQPLIINLRRYTLDNVLDLPNIDTWTNLGISNSDLHKASSKAE